MIKIFSIGKKHEDWVSNGIERYQKRLKPPFDVTWELLPHSSLDGDRARQEESERLLKRVTPRDYVVLLDEMGSQISSPALSAQLEDSFVHTQPVTIIIGGAFGVDTSVRQRADTVLSLSRLVFPHQLVRLILIEQLYRAQEISRGSDYHHV